jgi:hypothetical protein
LKPAAGSPLINRGVAYSAPENPKRIDAVPNGLDYDGVPVGVTDIGLYAASFNGLSGTVTNMVDEPVSGAVVKLNENIQATTGADGKYSFATVSPGVYSIIVSAASYMDSTTSFTANADAVSWLPLKTGDYTGVAVKDVSGTVTSDGTLLAGVTVTIKKNGTTAGMATTGSTGSYTITNVPSGNGYTVTASKEGYESWDIVDFVVPLVGEPEAANFNLVSSTKVYYNDDFDTLDDWTIQGGTNHTVEIIVDPDEPTNNLLHINKASGGAGGIYNKTNAGAYGVFTIETRMKRSISQSNGTGQFHLYTYQSDKFTGSGSANPSANIVFVGGQIKTHLAAGSSTVTNVQAYAANTWYEIALRVDTATDTFDFYVNGVKRNSGSIRTAVDTIDIFNLASGGTGSGFGDFWVDYIKVYQGEPEFLSGN